jgi:hypothetical protein
MGLAWRGRLSSRHRRPLTQQIYPTLNGRTVGLEGCALHPRQVLLSIWTWTRKATEAAAGKAVLAVAGTTRKAPSTDVIMPRRVGIHAISNDKTSPVLACAARAMPGSDRLSLYWRPGLPAAVCSTELVSFRDQGVGDARPGDDSTSVECWRIYGRTRLFRAPDGDLRHPH